MPRALRRSSDEGACAFKLTSDSSGGLTDRQSEMRKAFGTRIQEMQKLHNSTRGSH